MSALQPDTNLYNVTYQAHEYQGMPYRYLGGSGLQGSAVGLGTWKFGIPETGDGARVGVDDAMSILNRACDLGVMFWDTANRYNAASGNSERVIGRWLGENPGRRRDVVLATKTHGGMDGWTPNHSGLSRLQIIESVKASLERLQTDWLDVLWFHRFDENVPMAESLEAVEDLVRQGMVRYLAVSNFSASQLHECLNASDKISRRVRPIAVQNRFDPLNGEAQPGVRDLCIREGLSFVPYSPLAQGLLTDRYVDFAKVGPGDRLFDEGNVDSVTDVQRSAIIRLNEVARELDVKPSTLTLAYLLTMPGMGSQIPSSTTVRQLEENAEAGRLVLNDTDVSKLREIFVQ